MIIIDSDEVYATFLGAITIIKSAVVEIGRALPEDKRAEVIAKLEELQNVQGSESRCAAAGQETLDWIVRFMR